MNVNAYAAESAAGELKPFEYELGAIGPEEVDIRVAYCGICHSDLSMLNNDWQMTRYPFVPGHEIVGRIETVGPAVRHLAVGQTVGLGWFAKSCMTCRQCMSGNHNLCPDAQGTIIERHGGFADRIRAHMGWVIPLPEGVAPASAGPLFCGGITVFNPIVQNHIRPTDRVGVIGIGGLGHMALAFLRAWGCEVTAFSTSPEKEEEARRLGAHHFLNSRDTAALEKRAGYFDMILSTVNVSLPWEAYIGALAPKGKLHLVGAAPSVQTAVFPLLIGQRSVGASPMGSPATTGTMLDFAARHGIAPQIETFPMSRVNDAMEKLRSGKPRYRIVLENDF